jgi:hypothetical protein
MFIQTPDGTIVNLSQVGGIKIVKEEAPRSFPTRSGHSLYAILPAGMGIVAPEPLEQHHILLVSGLDYDQCTHVLNDIIKHLESKDSFMVLKCPDPQQSTP